MKHGYRVACVLLVAALGALLAGCAGGGSAGLGSAGSGPAVEAPTYRVGDRWVYAGEDGFRVKTRWEEIHEVTAVGANGISVRVTKRGGAGDSVRTEQWSAAGLVVVGAIFADETRRFAAPLKRYEFPLAAGRAWSQWVDQFDETREHEGQINHYVHVLGQEQVVTAAGTFDALKLHIVMRLDDEDPFRWATQCNYVAWYAPSVRNLVRETKDAQYLEKGGRDSAVAIRTQYGTLELVSFRPGGS